MCHDRQLPPSLIRIDRYIFKSFFFKCGIENSREKQLENRRSDFMPVIDLGFRSGNCPLQIPHSAETQITARKRKTFVWSLQGFVNLRMGKKRAFPSLHLCRRLTNRKPIGLKPFLIEFSVNFELFTLKIINI